MLVSIAVVGLLASGCGPGAATGAGPTSAANPHLPGVGLRHPTPGSASGVARTIAARWAAAGASADMRTTRIEYQTIDYTATVFSPGTPEGFTAFITTRRTTLVTPASAATIYADNGARPRFATPTDQALWQAAGRPSLGQAATTGQTQTIPVGQFSFLPQGSTLTYRQAAALPAEPTRLAAVILDHLRPYAGTHPPASLVLKQLAYLIATAPLTDQGRSAAWQAVASLPGLRTCQTRSGRARDRAINLCIASAYDQTLVSVDIDTGAILAIADRLLRPTSLYPHVRVGTIVGSSTFPAV
jgi:hypothetical protein